jgi:hypothetical protein
MIKTSYLLTLALVIGCEGTNKDHPSNGGTTCKPAEGDMLIASTNDTANLTTLENLGTTAPEIGRSFEKTIPSGLSWTVKDKNLVLDGETYSLSYDQESDHWNVIDANGVMKGNLTPYRSSSCETVSSFKLVMFMPAEEATGSIWYMTL